MWHLGIFLLFLPFQPVNGISLPVPQFNDVSFNRSLLASQLNRIATSTFLFQDKRLNEIKAALANNTEHKRFKRQLEVPEQRDSEESSTLRDVALISTLTAPSVIADVVYAKTSTNSFIVGAGKTNFDGTRGSVPSPVWRWNDYTRKFELMATVETPGSVAVEGFSMEDDFYFIFAINTKDNLLDYAKHPTKLYKVNSNGDVIQLQTFPTTGATGWKYFSRKHGHYLAQTSLVQWKRNDDLKGKYAHVAMPKGSSEIQIFKWNGIAFSHLHSLSAMHATTVDVTTIAGRTLIVAVNQTFGETDVKSTVLIYEFYISSDNREHVKLIQGIGGWAVSDVHFVRVQRKNFLFIANEFRVRDGQKLDTLDSVVYRFNGLFFVKYQTIITTCALKWTTLNGIEDRALIHLLSAKDERIFELIDDSWTPISTPLLKPTSITPRITIGVKSFVHQRKNLVALALMGTVDLKEMAFVKHSPVIEKYGLNAKCAGISRILSEVTHARREYGASHDRAASRKMHQILVGIKHFQDVEIRNLRLEKMKVVQTHLYRRVLEKHLRMREDIFAKYPHNLEGFLKKSNVQYIRTNLTVDNIFVNKMETAETQFNVVNDVPFCKFLSQIVTFDQTSSQPLDTIRASFNRLKFENDVIIRGTLNSVSVPSGLVFLDKPNRFVAPKNFEHGISVNGSVKVKTTINNIKPEHILLTHGHQIINAETIIHGDIRVVSLDVVRNHKVAGVDWNWLVNETVRIDKPIVIRGRKRFLSDVTIVGDFSPKGLVSGVDVKNLFRKAVPLAGQNRFLRPIKFSNVKFQKDVTIMGKINGISVPSDLIERSKTPWEVSLVLSRSLDLRYLDVKGFINGQKIDKYHVMTRHGVQTITGAKKFNTIHVHPSLKISGLINGFNLTQLLKRIRSGVTVADTHYPKLTVHSLIVAGSLPDNLNRLFYKSVKLHEDFKFRGHVTFEDTTIFEKNLELPPVIFEPLVPIKSRKPIHLPTEYLDDVVFENNVFVEGLINNIDIVKFSKNTLKISGNQVVRSPKTFVGTIHVGTDSSVKGKLNAIYLKDAVKINEDSIVKGKVIFQVSPVIYGFSVFENTVVTSTLNNRRVSHWFEDTLLINSPQNITAPKKFIGTVDVGERKIYKNLNVDGAVFLNGAALNEFVEDVVLEDETNILLQETTFSSRLSIKELQTVTIDNVNIVDLFENALRLKENRRVTMKTNVDVKHLQTTYINDEDIKEFFSKVVFVHDRKLPSSLSFHHVIAPEIVVEGLVNGLEFKQDVVRISSKEEIEISGRKTFSGGLSVNRLVLHGKINGIDLERVNKYAVKRGVPQTITAVVNVEELTVTNVHAKALVGGHNFTTFLEDSWFVDRIAIIYGETEFFAVHHIPAPTHSMLINGLLDTVDITHAFDDIVTTDDRQVITGHFTFKNKIAFNKVSVPNITCSSGNCFVNGKVLSRWTDGIMTKNTKQIVTSPKTFEGLVTIENLLTVEGRVNQILLDDIVKAKGEQRVYDNKIFTHVTVLNLEVRGSLMGVDVVRWERESVFLGQPSESILIFSEHNEFTSLVLEQDSFFKHGLGDVVTSDIVTVHGEREITGRKIFTNEITILPWTKSMHLSGEVNGIRETFVNVLSRLLSFPLPYPCPADYVYFREGCYRIIPQPNADCDVGSKRLRTINNFEKNLLTTMKLVERNGWWFIRNSNIEITICRLDARTHLTESIVLRGNFTFNLDATTIVKATDQATRHSLSPLQVQIFEEREKFSVVQRKIDLATNKLGKHRQCMCSTMDNFESAFKNAYKPLGTMDVIQTIGVNALGVYLLDTDSSGRDLSLIIVIKDAISLYHWRGGKFRDVASLHVSPIPVTSKIEITKDAKSGVILITILTSIRCKSSEMMDEFKILYLNVVTDSSMSGPSIRLIKQNSVQLTCIPETNVRLVLIKDDAYFIHGFNNSISISRWDDPNQSINLKLYRENIDIYHVYPVDVNGRVAIASQYNGVNFFTIYQTDVIERRLDVLFSLYNLPKFIKMTVASPYDLIFLTKTQLHLVYYDSSTGEFSTKQVMNVDCPTDLFWLTTRDFHWLVVSACRISYFYTFDGYLNQLYEVGEVVMGEPQVYSSDEDILAVIPVANDKGKEIKILKGNIKGPARTIDCRTKC